MSKKDIFIVNNAGVREMLHWESVQELCNGLADKVASNAGTGYVVRGRNYPRRYGAAVVALSKRAKRDNMKNNTLLKALGAAK